MWNEEEGGGGEQTRDDLRKATLKIPLQNTSAVLATRRGREGRGNSPETKKTTTAVPRKDG